MAHGWLALILGLVLAPMLVPAALPRRWVGWGALFWLCLPAVVTVAMG